MILTDYNQFCIASFFAVRKHEKDLEKNLKMLRHLVLSTLGNMNNKFKTEYGQFVLCCDSGESWRKDKKYFPYYKARRIKKKRESDIDWKSFYENIGIIKTEIQENLNFHVISAPGAEADDIIAYMCRISTEPTLILSADRDFIQLQKNPNVKQWDNKLDVWVRHKDPEKYLFEHIMKGDTGDDIPNVLSDDDTFITEGKRQKPMTQKLIDEMWETKNINFEKVNKDRLRTNMKIIDLENTPAYIIKNIEDVYEKERNKQIKGGVYKYFAKKGLSKMLDRVGEFK